MSAKDLEECDWYAILSVPLTASADDISKAYRSLARKYHPDRNASDLTAANQFQRVKRASEILLDDTLRGLYDNKIRARLLREQRALQDNENVRRMKNELMERERMARTCDRFHSVQDDSLRALRARNEQIKMSYGQRLRTEPKNSNDMQTSNNSDGNGNSNVTYQRTQVKVKWSNTLEYSAEEIRNVFGHYGTLEGVAIVSKSHSALIEFKRYSEALRAVQQLDPRTGGSALLSRNGHHPVFKKVVLIQQGHTKKPPEVQKHSMECSPSLDDIDVNSEDFEEIVLKRMREANQGSKWNAAS